MRWTWLVLVAPMLMAASPPAPAPAPAPAAPTPAQIVSYRQAVMKAASGHMGALSLIAKGQSARVQDASLHAAALRDLAATMGALFPEGSGPAPGLETEAKAEIWTSKDKFAAAAKALETAVGPLVEASKGTDVAAIKAALGSVGGACGDCHDAFKVDEDHH